MKGAGIMHPNKSSLADAVDTAYDESLQNELSFEHFGSVPLETNLVSDAYENDDFWFASTDGSSDLGSSTNNVYSEPSFTHDTPMVHPPSSGYFEEYQTHCKLPGMSATSASGSLQVPTLYSTSYPFFPHGMMPMAFSHTTEEEVPMPTPLQAHPGAPEGFVNVYVRVDPVQNTVTFPEQTLQYQNETCAVIDEALLPIVSASDIDCFHRQYLQQQLQALSHHAQQQQQLHFSGTEPNYSCVTSSYLPVMRASPPASASLMSIMAQRGKPNGIFLPSPMQPMVHNVRHNIQISSPLSEDTTTADTSLLSKSGGTLPLVKKMSTKTKSKKAAREDGGPTLFEPLPPARALSAYNFFFRYERERILQHGCDDVSQPLPLDYYDHSQWTSSNSLPFQRDVLVEHWARDRTVKRKHRKSHGRISFKTLTKRISASWHALPEPAKDVFREIAAQDFQRFTQEVTLREISKSLPST